MYIFFASNNSVSSQILEGEKFRQGDVNANTIYVSSVNYTNLSYMAWLKFELPDEETQTPEIPMTATSFTYLGVVCNGFKFTIEDPIILSQHGELKATVRYKNGAGVIAASGTVVIPVEQTVYEPSPSITLTQYNVLLSLFDKYLQKVSKYYPHVVSALPEDLVSYLIGGTLLEAIPEDLTDYEIGAILFVAGAGDELDKVYEIYDNDGVKDIREVYDLNEYLEGTILFVKPSASTAYDIYEVYDNSGTLDTRLIKSNQEIDLDEKIDTEIGKIIDGTYIVKKAEQDKNGNDIFDTYETKADATTHKERTTILETFKNTTVPATYATKSELSAEVSRAEGAEGALDTAKADKATTLSGYGITNAYTKTEADTLLNAKADKSDTYTKTEVNNLVASVYKFKGSVDTYDDLPTESLTIGDVYNVVDSGINYAWTGTTWDDIGGVEALATLTNDGLMSKEDFGKLQDLYTKAQLDTLLGNKADLDANDKVLTEQMPYYVEILHADLLALLDSSELVVGQYYRITDYVTTTVQANTQSAGHAFDILVRAVAVNRLDEHARALRHAGDTYFANAKLEAWQLKYSIVNDEIFKWADTENGKGVIYYMKDEFNNELAYDFKNIKFLRDAVYYFTFTWITEDNTIWDASIHPELTNDENQGSRVFGNIIPLTKSHDGDNLYILNDNVFIADFDNDVGNFYGWRENICQDYFVSNTFGDSCYSNTFGNDCSSNTFGNNCYSNTFGNDYFSNTFGDGCYSNTFGNYCYSNIFGNDCSSNIFGDGCVYLLLADNIRNLHVASNVVGSSDLNPLLIDDSAFVGKDHNIYIEQDTDGNTIAYWYDDLQTKHGLYKASPTDETWTEMPNQFVNRTTVLTDTVADVVASKGREIAIDGLTGSYLCLAFYNGSTYDVKFIGTQDNSVRGKKGVAGTATLVEVFNASTTDYSCLISGTTFESYVASPSVARSGYYTINDGSSSTYIRGSTYYLTSAGVVTSLIGDWVNMTLETGWSAVENYTPQYKVFPYGVIFTRGRVLRGTGGSSTITIMPAGLRPSQSTDYINSSSSGGSLTVMAINSSGSITTSANEGVVVELNYSYAL